MKKDDTDGWHIDDLIKECAAKNGNQRTDMGFKLPVCPYINQKNKHEYSCKYMGHGQETRITCYYTIVTKKEEKKK